MQIVVRKVRHTSVAIRATGYVSRRIVAERFHFAQRICFAGHTIQAVERPARDVIVRICQRRPATEGIKRKLCDRRCQCTRYNSINWTCPRFWTRFAERLNPRSFLAMDFGPLKSALGAALQTQGPLVLIPRQAPRAEQRK